MIVCSEAALEILKKRCDALCKDGGIYYEIIKREEEDSYLFVLFFEDGRLDVHAEHMEIKARLKLHHSK